MGKIQLPNGTIKNDERRNGRLRLSFGDWVKIISIAMSLILGGAYLKWTVNANCEEIKKIKEEDKQDDSERRELQKDVAVLKQDVQNIKETVQRIERKQERVQTEQSQLLNQILIAIKK